MDLLPTCKMQTGTCLEESVGEKSLWLWVRFHRYDSMSHINTWNFIKLRVSALWHKRMKKQATSLWENIYKSHIWYCMCIENILKNTQNSIMKPTPQFKNGQKLSTDISSNWIYRR